jgi:LEA14-like dessication related protein
VKTQIIVLFMGFLVVGGGAVATGVIETKSPSTVADQFDVPTSGVEDTQFTGQSSNETDLKITYWIDNPNPISGEISQIEYKLWWSETRNGTYQFMGDGQDSNISIPANENTTYNTTAHLQSDSAAQAYTTQQTQGSVWVRTQITVSLDFGPNPIEITTERKVLME